MLAISGDTNILEDFMTGKESLASIITVVLGPLRLFTDPLFKGIMGMDTASGIAKAFGLKIIKCKYCDLYFSSISTACKKSPIGKHQQ
jgi:hypothetical protein